MSKQLNPVVPDQPIVLGKMGSTYGIRGWLRVFSSTENALFSVFFFVIKNTIPFFFYFGEVVNKIGALFKLISKAI